MPLNERELTGGHRSDLQSEINLLVKVYHQMQTSEIHETTKEPRQMADVLEDLARVRVTKARIQTDLETITGIEASYRDELQARMEADGIRTGQAYGLMAQLKTRKSVVVTDMATLTASLNEAGVLDDHLVLNKTSAAREAVKHGWAGAAAEETTYLSIGEVRS